MIDDIIVMLAQKYFKEEKVVKRDIRVEYREIHGKFPSAKRRYKERLTLFNVEQEYKSQNTQQ